MNQQIHVLDVAEVDNLLLLPNIIRAVAVQLGHNPDTKFQATKELVFSRLDDQVDQQIAQHTIYRVEGALKRAFDTSGRTANDLQNAVNTIPSKVLVLPIWTEVNNMFKKVRRDRDYLEVLRLFNEKTLVRQVAQKVFQLGPVDSEDGLSNLVRRLIQAGSTESITIAIQNAIPTFVQRAI